MYGTRLTRDFGESVPDPWRSAIATLNDLQIQRGLRRLTAAGSASVPTLPQFVKACRQTGDDEGETRPAATYLPAPPVDPWVGLGNRALFQYLKTKGAASEQTLPKLVAVKNEIIAAADDSSEPKEVRDVLFAAFDKLWEAMPASQIEWHKDHFARTGRVFDPR